MWNRLFRRQYLGLNAHTENSSFRIAGVLHGLVPIVQKSRALAARAPEVLGMHYAISYGRFGVS